MAKIDFNKVAKEVFSKPDSELDINQWKEFYRRYLMGVKNHKAALPDLYDLLIRHKEAQPGTGVIVIQENNQLNIQAESILLKHFGNRILELYNKEVSLPDESRKTVNPEDGFWLGLLISVSGAFAFAAEKARCELEYKTRFLSLLYDCLRHHGLHPSINKRDAKKYKRYNVVLEHNFKSPKAIQKEVKVLVSANVLQSEYLNPYEKQLPLKMGGKLIPFKDIYQIRISSTLLLDDEIELFANKNGFLWTKTARSQEEFVRCCSDETDTLLKNPYLLKEEKGAYRNQNVDFVNPTRIAELKKLKSKDFDLIKLVKLCEELNVVSSAGSHLGSSMLLRAVIDHVPPVFGFQTFAEVANNYNGGTKSFKKSMMVLNSSLRNIADNNIHSQVRAKEVLPTSTQVDFSPELDLLLGEIVRILK